MVEDDITSEVILEHNNFTRNTAMMSLHFITASVN